jgi:hypothetical protein
MSTTIPAYDDYLRGPESKHGGIPAEEMIADAEIIRAALLRAVRRIEHSGPANLVEASRTNVAHIQTVLECLYTIRPVLKTVMPSPRGLVSKMANWLRAHVPVSYRIEELLDSVTSWTGLQAAGYESAARAISSVMREFTTAHGSLVLIRKSLRESDALFRATASRDGGLDRR